MHITSTSAAIGTTRTRTAISQAIWSSQLVSSWGFGGFMVASFPTPQQGFGDCKQESLFVCRTGLWFGDCGLALSPAASCYQREAACSILAYYSENTR